MNALLASLRERAKELDCLYRVDEILGQVEVSLHRTCEKIVRTLPPGWQYPEVCWARLELDGVTCSSTDQEITSWRQQADIVVQGEVLGRLTIFYSREMPEEDEGPFLKEEIKLLRAICDHIGNYLLQRKMHEAVRKMDAGRRAQAPGAVLAWRSAFDALGWSQKCAVSNTILQHLRRADIPDAECIRESCSTVASMPDDEPSLDPATATPDEVAAILDLASTHFGDERIQNLIQDWLREDQPSVLARLVNRNVSVAGIAAEIQRYHFEEKDVTVTSPSRLRSIQAALVRRFLSERPDYISVASKFTGLADFNQLLQKTVFGADSHGRLGGQAARFFLGEGILRSKRSSAGQWSSINTPRTWYITSDVLFHFLRTQGLDYITEQKYKPAHQVESEYRRVTDVFQKAQFPSDIVDLVKAALNDLGEVPLVVRHSSVLDGLPMTSFAGRYRSVFVANQGSLQERTSAVLKAVAEVYASMFGPEPIRYRSEHGTVDLGEEMGVMIQQAVGNQVGKYFLPAFSGTARCKCDELWLPGMRSRDGMIFLVPGLDLNRVERADDDYPVMVSPEVPGKCVYDSVGDRMRYSPKNLHVLDLETSGTVTIALSELMAQGGGGMPCVNRIFSVAAGDDLLRLQDGQVASANDNLVATFECLMSCTSFISQIKWVMRTLEKETGGPVEVSFASDGEQLFFLDYRSQDCDE